MDQPLVRSPLGDAFQGEKSVFEYQEFLILAYVVASAARVDASKRLAYGGSRLCIGAGSSSAEEQGSSASMSAANPGVSRRASSS
jgi:hypothetical protein